jgi:hypothetical protein
MTRRRKHAGDPFDDLLDGCSSDGSALAELLSAARAPGAPDEMLGLPSTRAAFLDARRPRRTAIRLPAAGRLAALKVLAAVSGATMIGGVAYAATEANFLGGTGGNHQKPPAASSPAGPHHDQSRSAGPQGGGGGTGPETGPAGNGTAPGAANGPGSGRPGSDGGQPYGSGANSTHPVGPGEHSALPHRAHPTHPAHPSSTSHPEPTPSGEPHPSHTPSSEPDGSNGTQRGQLPVPTPSTSEKS